MGKCQSKHTIDRFNPQPLRLRRRLTSKFSVCQSSFLCPGRFTAGSQVQAPRKRIHATLFEFLRNDALDARNYFSTTVDPLKRNQFGFVSGPVVFPNLYSGKDKLFWMFAYEATRRRQAVTSTTVVPTLKECAGDFSDVSATIVDPFTIIPFPGNVIPGDLI